MMTISDRLRSVQRNEELAGRIEEHTSRKAAKEGAVGATTGRCRENVDRD
jgi:hypothetical protein